MKSVVGFMQNADAVAFVLLGVAVGFGWARRRDRSTGYLALAIVLLSSVSLLGRIPALLHFTPPLLTEVSLAAFVGCAYALLRYRASLIPLPNRWHAAAVVAVAAAGGLFVVLSYFARAVSTPVKLGAAVAFILVWCAIVVEPIVRFWLVARGLPAVQAWRLRSLSLGFAGIVLILVFAIGASAAGANQVAQLTIQVIVLGIVPLLYVSFAPPSWLRRQWRSSEEEGLRAFMQDLLLLREDRAALANRALEWAMRLAGGASAVVVESDGEVLAMRGLDEEQVAQIRTSIEARTDGVHRVEIDGADTALLLLQVGGTKDAGRLAVLAGPFTPGFGSDEISRVQQFMTAVAAALDRARLLDRLRDANAQLQEANKHKSVFLASMSHELRTPLNAILGFSELLIDAPDGQHTKETQVRFLQQIHTSGQHLLGLINDILDLSKIEAGQMELRLQQVAVAEVTEQVRNIVEPLVAQKQIRLETAVIGVGDIEADAGKFKQMLLNLVSNAIKFTPAGGMVRISARRLVDAVEVTVSDTGIGIAPADQSRIFHEFQQVDSGIDRQQQGTGLGLTLTRRFARLHGGEVRVESEPGKGSVFTIHMPLAAATQEPAVEGIQGDAHSGGDAALPLVLIVEDDPPASELLSRQLGRAGFRTEVVRSGSEVMSRARQRKPAAITLDILLPGIDGWEVLTRLKDDETTSSIPVIVISVVDNPELAIALGAVDYFVKPVPARELIGRLRRFKIGVNGSGAKTQVLVVDDERANRDWLKEVLEPAGFGVISAVGGREAIELARARRPDLVLLDLMMPEVSGFDVVEALRSDRATSNTPIMVLTAKDLTEADKRQLNGRVSNILQRGTTGASDLVSMLRQVIGDEAAEA
ncbi:MAG: response regulator [Chloroflexi bacterium]|nr:MAG: response regulator [Chloroflexota bacterium]